MEALLLIAADAISAARRGAQGVARGIFQRLENWRRSQIVQGVQHRTPSRPGAKVRIRSIRADRRHSCPVDGKDIASEIETSDFRARSASQWSAKLEHEYANRQFREPTRAPLFLVLPTFSRWGPRERGEASKRDGGGRPTGSYRSSLSLFSNMPDDSASSSLPTSSLARPRSGQAILPASKGASIPPEPSSTARTPRRLRPYAKLAAD